MRSVEENIYEISIMLSGDVKAAPTCTLAVPNTAPEQEDSR
jgi:hypothetical protein